MPDANRLSLETNSTLLVKHLDGSVLWKVTTREHDGWAVEQISPDDAESRHAHYSDQALLALRSGGNLNVLGPAFAKLPKDRQALLCRARPLCPKLHETIRKARLTILRQVKKKMADGEARNLAAAIRQVVKALPTRSEPGWGSGFYNGQAPTTEMVKKWWGWWEAAGNDARILAPLFSKRGHHGSHLTESLRAEIHTALEEKFLIPTRPRMQLVVREFNDGRTRDVSRKTFEKVLEDDWSDFEIYKLQKGEKAARLMFGIFDEIADPEYPLQRVEMDHCLLDVLVPRPGTTPARPWLTAMIDACTRMITGFHLTFEKPSFQSCRLAFVHAFLPKDLEGRGCTNTWPCEGIPLEIVCDHAAEFRCPEMKEVEDELDFTIKQLPGSHPWLKGRIERFFGTMQIGVLSFEEGKTFNSTKQKGDFKPTPKSTLPEIEAKLLKWIVDKYHVRKHDGLGGKKPLDVWQQKIAEHGLDRPTDRDRVTQAFRAMVLKPIGPYGVTYKKKTYCSDLLEEVKKNHPPRTRYWCDIFYAEHSAIRLFDHKTGYWMKLLEKVPRVLEVTPRAARGAPRKPSVPQSPLPPGFPSFADPNKPTEDLSPEQTNAELFRWAESKSYANFVEDAKSKTKISKIVLN